VRNRLWLLKKSIFLKTVEILRIENVRKCLPKPRRSFVGFPQAKFFQPFSGSELFNRHACYRQSWQKRDKVDTTMTAETNKLVMRRFLEFINTASEKLAQELISADAIFHVPRRREPLRGPTGYLAIIGMMRGENFARRSFSTATPVFAN
jgi:hypothetical protein